MFDTSNGANRNQKSNAVIPVFAVCSSLSIPGNAQQSHRHERVLHSFETQLLTDIYYSEGASAGDLNGDGAADIVCGPSWYAGPSLTVKQEISTAVPQNRKGYADNFFS